MPTYLTFVLLTPLIGITALTMITAANTFDAADASAPEMRGRVMALYLMVFMGGTPIGLAAPRLGRRDVRRPLDARSAAAA